MKEFAEEVQSLLDKNDYVRVVKCRHCKHREELTDRASSAHVNLPKLWCNVCSRAVNYGDYCSWGERKEDGRD